ncbi:MFS transporter [Chloroflexota bacterium]
MVTVSSLFLGLGYLLMSQVSTIWQLYLFYGVIIGISTSAFWVPLLSTVARWFARRRGMMTSVTLTGVGIGSMIMPPIANWLISDYSWRTSYIIMGIVVLVLIIPAAQFLNRDPDKMGLLPYGGEEVEAQRLNLQANGFSLQQAIQTRQFWIFIFITFCSSVGPQAIMVHIVPYAIDLGITAANAATILIVMAGVGIVARIIIGYVGDKIGYKPIYSIGFILIAVSLFWVTQATEMWMFYLFGAIFMLGSTGTGALQSPMVAQLFGMRSHGVIFGVTSLSWTIGAAVGPSLAGGIFDITDSYQLAWLICITLAATGIIATSLLKPIHDMVRAKDSFVGGSNNIPRQV